MTFHIRSKKRQKPGTCFCSSIVVERNYLRQGLAFFFHRGKKSENKKTAPENGTVIPGIRSPLARWL